MRKVDFAVNVEKTVIPHIYMFVFSSLALRYVGSRDTPFLKIVKFSRDKHFSKLWLAKKIYNLFIILMRKLLLQIHNRAMLI